MLSQEQTLSLAEAREIARRAINKAEALAQRGAFVVVDDGGVVITASRMDGAGKLGIPISRAKAYGAAVNRETSAQFAARMSQMFVGIFLAYQDLARDSTFPGPGAMPIRKNGQVVGAISTGAGIGPFCKFEGVDPAGLVVDGKPTNAEDLIVAYALGLAYVPQHGDDMKRWTDAYGAAPNHGAGTGFSIAPPATMQTALDAATRMTDAAMAEAGRRKQAVAVAVTDRHGDIVCIDRMDDAPPMTPDVAEAVAVTALNFRAPSGTIPRDAAQFAAAAPFKFLPVPGGLPVERGGRIVGAVGVGGADQNECAKIAEAALAALGN
jgi:uncharacterized protein GlcG (DUF336 family)